MIEMVNIILQSDKCWTAYDSLVAITGITKVVPCRIV